ncbi:hypothetical protein OKHIF_06580 [Mycobacteroides chelonae]
MGVAAAVFPFFTMVRIITRHTGHTVQRHAFTEVQRHVPAGEHAHELTLLVRGNPES